MIFPSPGLKADFIGYENITAFAELAQKVIDKNTRNVIAVGKFESKVYSSRLAGIRKVINDSGIKLQQIDISDRPVRDTAIEISSK